MALAPWLKSNGAPVIDAAGKPVLCDSCPCQCPCPCDPWPPESWPCGGLAETYQLTAALEFRIGGVLREKQEWSGTLTAASDECTWFGAIDRTIYDYDRSGNLCGTRLVPAGVTMHRHRVDGVCVWLVAYYGAAATNADTDPTAGTWTLTGASGSWEFEYGDTCAEWHPLVIETADVGWTSFAIT